MNNGKRAFIVRSEDVTEGGEKHPDKVHTYINPGDTVEVGDKLGKFLSTYPNVTVIEKTKGKK